MGRESASKGWAVCETVVISEYVRPLAPLLPSGLLAAFFNERLKSFVNRFSHARNGKEAQGFLDRPPILQ